MAIEAALSLRSALASAVASLRAAGIADARGEALRILAAIRGEAPGAAIASGVESLDAEQAAALARAVARRAMGEPLPYVVGRAGFRHLVLAVDRSTLIPRPETEGLVERAAARVHTGAGRGIADIGTGSGCIAASLATELGVPVIAVELSREALAVARRNIADARAPVSLIQGDLTAPLADDSCGVLVSNPPYLSGADHAALDAGVRDWEPVRALVSGDDGMAATSRLLEDGLRVVRKRGWIALEVDCRRSTEAARRAYRLGWRDVTIENDLFGRERYLLARRCDA